MTAPSRQRGSAAVELTLATPLLVLLMLFAVAAGRLVNARLEVDSAARHAARAASIARTPDAARADAAASARRVLRDHDITCQTFTADTDTRAFRPGGHVAVTVTCHVSTSGLTMLQLPGHIAVRASFSAPVDQYRGGQPAGRYGISGDVR